MLQTSSQNQPSDTSHALATLGPYFLRYKRMVMLGTFALLTSATAMLSIPVGVRHMIDEGFIANNSQSINHYFLILIAIGSIVACASALRFFCVNWIGERIVADLRARVFAHMTHLSPAFYEETHSGEVMSRLTADTTQIKASVGTAASQALRNTVMLIGALVMMLLTSTQLSILVIFAIPVITLPLMAYGRLIRHLSRQAQDTLAEASSYAGENLSAIRTLQAFRHEKTAINIFTNAVEQAFKAAITRTRARAILTAIAMALVFASVVIILWVGAQSVIAGDMSGGQLGQFVLYSLFAAGAVGELSEVWGEVQQTAGATERISELLTIQPEINEPKKPVTLTKPITGGIHFSNVSFTYPTQQDTQAIQNVSFKIEPGTITALVGPSGAGKTTLFSLLLRFYDPTSGSITIDNTPIRDMSLQELRNAIAIVPQDITLFADTIAHNICYGSPNAPQQDIENAARTAQSLEFIQDLPKGFQTKLGERGITLSGGQHQRIAIARAVLKNAPILLLDEATSALDAEREEDVQRALEKIMKNRTTFVIAHRLATVKKANNILVMDNGKIVETGNHQTLIAQNGLYARLAKLQFSEN
ncbi:MAG: ABC transporter transmembrane domain-containing protein [Pseudomonadota bacterium]